jgi:uncharacterized membrane protein YbhN (UPF0104 family)
MNRRRLSRIAAVPILLLTIAAFVYYFGKHPEVKHQLAGASPYLLGALVILYLASLAALGAVTYATLRLCRVNLEKAESLLLTAYTAVINFFGPLQSGPAFRAVYLKAKYGIKLKNYAAATLVYYFFWGLFSLLMLLSGVLGWWILLICLTALAAAYSIRRHPRLQGIDLNGWYLMALATAAQILCVCLIYFLELRSVAPGTGFSQAIIYTGAANLALFVSLTPGAIGFRE